MIECSALNRLRGTGDVIKIGKLVITGTILYALYLGLVIGLITEWYFGLGTIVLFLAGESYGWGKWVGSLTRFEPIDKELQESCYKDDEGKGFPYIHYVANSMVKERSNYLWYCRVALAIRGFIWWYPVYVLFAFAGLISYTEALVIGVVLGVSFPVACWVGTKIEIEGKIWIVNYSRGWENQELVYGLMQGMCLWYVILKVVYE